MDEAVKSPDVLVTGASAGLGEALCRMLADRGSRVWGVARRANLLEGLKKDVPPGRFFYSICDVASRDQVQTVISSMDAQGFIPRVVILNAGVNIHDLEPDFDLSQCEQVFRVNLFGALIWVDQLLPKFLHDGGGRFVAISSMSAFRVTSHGTAYAASKAALSMAFESLRLRYRSSAVRFTTVHLGPVDTAMWPGGHFPFLLSPETAAKRILGAIDKGKEVYDCPALMVLLARLSGLLPRSFVLVSERLVKKASGV